MKKSINEIENKNENSNKVENIENNEYNNEIKNSKISIRQRLSLMKMLPNIITISSLCFGLSAIRCALFHKWEIAVMCVFVSALLDALDGRVARMVGTSSQFGMELDSLSDLVCFGVAPSMLVFLRVMYHLNTTGWGICMFFTVCCALRLARFNAVQIMNVPQADWTKKYFTGVPAPAGAIIALFPMIISFAFEEPTCVTPFFTSLCVLCSGILMISRIRTFSSKMIEFNEGFASPELVIMSLIIICLINSPWITLSVLIAVYILTIPYGAYCYRCRKIADLENQNKQNEEGAKNITEN